MIDAQSADRTILAEVSVESLDGRTCASDDQALWYACKVFSAWFRTRSASRRKSESSTGDNEEPEDDEKEPARALTRV
jgi:hypothetical protein